MAVSKITIGTRRSKLALWQADHVKDLIEKNFSIPVELKKITTSGDKFLDQPLHDIGGKGLFLKEIEDELLSGSIDIAVHSMKDVPYEIPDGLVIAAILRREDPSDAFVSQKYDSISAMPAGSVLGTASLRRMIQLKRKYPGLEFKVLRGNVDTRLRKLDEGQYDGVILATAGLIRLGYADRIRERLEIISAVGQGAVGIECRKDRAEISAMIQKLSDEATEKNVRLERYFSKKIQGTCDTPMGCFVRPDESNPKQFKLNCFLSKPDGTDYFEKEISGKWDDGERLIDDIIQELTSH